MKLRPCVNGQMTQAQTTCVVCPLFELGVEFSSSTFSVDCLGSFKQNYKPLNFTYVKEAGGRGRFKYF